MGLALPSILLFHAIKAYVQTLSDGLRTNGRIPSDLRSKAFGKFWGGLSSVPPDPSAPLMGSAALVPPLLAQAEGVVLEVGPGTGDQTRYYEAAAAKIKKMYAAEPAKELHHLLRRNVDATKLGSKYVILAADGTKASILKELVEKNAYTTTELAQREGIFDTIVCIRVLCSVPDLEATISDLHEMLRPGGKLLILEHTANPWLTAKGSVIARLFQIIYTLLGWSYFVGDCSMNKHTEKMLRKDASSRWESVDIERHFGKAVLTYILGVLVKK